MEPEFAMSIYCFTYARELAAAAGCGDPLKLLIVLLLSEPKSKAQQLQHI
jgi:hypothetical protein